MEARILWKALASRIKDAVHNIVYHDQTANVDDRFTEESIRIVADLLLESANEENKDIILFMTNMEAEHEFVSATFKESWC